MIIPKEGGKLIPETFTALKKLKENGVMTCGLTNNFVVTRSTVLIVDYRPGLTLSAAR
jgi:ribonucleotide monophosphatase NagD (HAD superfamily)